MEKMDIDDQDSKVESVKGAKAKEAELRAQIAPMMVQAKAYAKVRFFFKNRRKIVVREKILNLQKNRVEISRVRWKF